MPLEKSSLGRISGFKQRGDDVIHQLDRALRTGQQKQQERKQNHPHRTLGWGYQHHHRGHNRAGEQGDAGHEEFVGMPPQPGAQAVEDSRVGEDFLQQQPHALGDQIVSDMRFAAMNARVAVFQPMRLPRQSERLLCDLDLGEISAGREFGDFVAIEVAAVEIHGCVAIRRILPQNLVKQDERFEGFFPQKLRCLTQALNACAQVLRLSGRAAYHAFGTSCNLFQQRQFERRGQRFELAQFEWSVFLEPAAECAERLLSEMASRFGGEPLCKSVNSRERFALRRVNVWQFLAQAKVAGNALPARKRPAIDYREASACPPTGADGYWQIPRLP